MNLKTKIVDILKIPGKTVFSFEFFPPKTEEGTQKLLQVFRELRELSPDFVSVTYGALGTTQAKSLEVLKSVNDISQEKELDAIYKVHGAHPFGIMAHYTCIGATNEKVDAFLSEIPYLGVENILALRGDAPQGMDIADVLSNSPFKHAIDLVRYIKKKKPELCIGVAGYPEGHPECKDKEEDLRHLKEKVDAGADFVVTQLFFDNTDFYRFCDRAYKQGITVPIIPGIMPIENYKQIQKITSMGPVNIPQDLLTYLQRTDVTDQDKVRFAIDFTTRQCTDLLAYGVKGLHFYTLNKSSATIEIFRRINPHDTH